VKRGMFDKVLRKRTSRGRVREKKPRYVVKKGYVLDSNDTSSIRGDGLRKNSIFRGGGRGGR